MIVSGETDEQLVAHPAAQKFEIEPPAISLRVGWLFAGTGFALFFLMMLVGLVMRLNQANLIALDPAFFYQLMTLHGAGMITGSLLAMMGALWFAIRSTVQLSYGRMLWSYGCLVGGVVAVLVAVMLGKFAAGWTFLSPLPFLSAGQWEMWATFTFLVGLVLVGVGFLIFCLDVYAAATGAYGGLANALGLGIFKGRSNDDLPPPQIIAATVVSLEGLIASAVGTTILAAMLGRVFESKVAIDPLWAKNLTFFFGHTIANLTIYLAVGLIYVLVPRYTGRPWKTTKPIVVGWIATLILVAGAYSHHLYMDVVQPAAAQYVSMAASFGAALPVAVVTIYTAMMLVWGSHYRWTLASSLIYLGFAGWAIGGMGAVIDAMIPANFRLHNTLWVPAHFHTYMLLGVMFWVMAFLAYLLERAADKPAERGISRVAIWLMLIGGYGLVTTWYLAGALGVPRRYAVHFGGVETYDVIGSLSGIVFLLGVVVLLVEFVRLGRVALLKRKEGTGSRVRSSEPLPAAHPRQPILRSPVAGTWSTVFVVATATVALAAFAPPVIDASESSAVYHHLDHAAQYLFGAVLAFAVASMPRFFAFAGRFRSFALGAVVLAPFVMLLAMTPSIYQSVGDNQAMHFLYHNGIVLLGIVTGVGAAWLGRSVGRVALVISVAMALMYAPGVTGG